MYDQQQQAPSIVDQTLRSGSSNDMNHYVPSAVGMAGDWDVFQPGSSHKQSVPKGNKFLFYNFKNSQFFVLVSLAEELSAMTLEEIGGAGPSIKTEVGSIW